MTAPTKPEPARGPAAPEDRPDLPNRAAKRMAPDLAICRDLGGGTSQVRAKGTAYLPQHPGEKSENYNVRLAGSVLFNGFTRTTRGLAGMVFRRNPDLGDDVPPEIQTDAENIDNEGTHLDVFAKEGFEDVLQAGHGGILVDYPDLGEARPTLAEERERGLRPYWVWVRKDDILSWRTEKIDGRRVLMQLVLRESGVRPVGRFGDEEDVRYRVLKRQFLPAAMPGQQGTVQVVWEIWRVEKEVATMERQGVIRNLTEIPFAIAYGPRRTGYLESDPPLLDLAHTTIAHYQVRSDHRHALHIASVPILVTTGADTSTSGETLVISPNTSIDLPKDADMKYVEHAGSALGQSRQELLDLKAEMAVLGLSMLMPETRAAETAEAKRIDKSEQDSALAAAARNFEDTLERALQFHAQFRGLKDGGSVELNRDFEQLALGPAEIQTYAGLVRDNVLSLDTLWSVLERGGALPEDFDPDVEKQRIRDMIGTPPATENDDMDDDLDPAA